jgi:hypothetical protein
MSLLAGSALLRGHCFHQFEDGFAQGLHQGHTGYAQQADEQALTSAANVRLRSMATFQNTFRRSTR